jgi:hypothetical protein
MKKLMFMLMLVFSIVASQVVYAQEQPVGKKSEPAAVKAEKKAKKTKKEKKEMPVEGNKEVK